jgi:transcriptional regulator with XRE-family HTH domain
MSDNSSPRNQGFSLRLKELRKQKQLSQTQLGELIGIHYTHIGRYERGTSMPNSETLKRLAETLGVTGDYLLEGSEDNVARARLGDRELLQQFQEVETLAEEDKHIVKVLIDAFLTKRKLRALAV